MKNGYNKMVGRVISATAVLGLMVFMTEVACYSKQSSDIVEIETVNVSDRSFDTITMDQYDKMVDYVYKFAGDEDFAIQYAVAECILNDIEKTGSQDDIDSYLDKLYNERSDHFMQTKFENESEDKQDAIREAVQSALDERTMPSGVTRAIYSTDTKLNVVLPDEKYMPSYLRNTTIQFYYH